MTKLGNRFPTLTRSVPDDQVADFVLDDGDEYVRAAGQPFCRERNRVQRTVHGEIPRDRREKLSPFREGNHWH